MSKKIKVGIIFGGKSAEHEVALQSAKNVINALNREKYEPVLIGIDKTGKWHLHQSAYYLLNENDPKLIALNLSDTTEVVSVPTYEKNQLIAIEDGQKYGHLDVVFPVLHGTFGEDGTIQGLLKLLDIPFVGAGVLGSAVGMDKDVMKRLLRDAQIPIPKFISINRIQRAQFSFETIVNELGLPFFMKPANSGSSVGIHKVHNFAEFEPALNDAFTYDTKILIEEFIKGREIECSVLGNYNPLASIPGEVIPTHEFYSYEAKYLDEKGATLQIPAKLPENIIKNVQELAIKTFQVLCCQGMARVDFFLQSDETLLVNEINTIPGFTRISMYPKLWEMSGISYAELIDRLIQLALERHQEEKALQVSFQLNG
ncbi:D-alanine--D-alanine ligase [candidate division KSB1 bacterium]|nr:D-alanine--D-alanine ligase [candidate division KSB1 bacterium]